MTRFTFSTYLHGLSKIIHADLSKLRAMDPRGVVTLRYAEAVRHAEHHAVLDLSGCLDAPL